MVTSRAADAAIVAADAVVTKAAAADKAVTRHAPRAKVILIPKANIRANVAMTAKAKVRAKANSADAAVAVVVVVAAAVIAVEIVAATIPGPKASRAAARSEGSAR